MAEPSWMLKLGRAQKHLDDLKAAIDKYAATSPYTVTEGIEHKGKRRVLVRRTKIAQPDDPWLPIIAGDFLFNVRSALDHIAVASVPRKRRYAASFPILTQDIWRRDGRGEYLKRYDDARRAWYTAIEGMTKEALAIVKGVQPYNTTDPENIGTKHHLLAILSALQNADKHRELVILAGFLRVHRLIGRKPDGTTGLINFEPSPSSHVLEHRAEVDLSELRTPDGQRVDPTGMEVEVQATVQMLARRTTRSGAHESTAYVLPETFDDILTFAREAVVKPLAALQP